MGVRRKSRELAMQALFYMDMQKDISCERLAVFCRNFTPTKKVLPFFNELTEGVIAHRRQIDKLIEQFSSNWKISRMSCVDRNIMRVAVYELLFCTEIPPKVSINEAIDVGKRFGTDESGAFINGILDTIRMAIEEGKIVRMVDPLLGSNAEDGV